MLAGLVLSAAIGGLAYWRGALSRGGVAGAMLVGTAVFGFGGLAWAVALAAFFVSSSLLSRFRAEQKVGAAARFSKGSRRDLAQVLANGGLAALIAVASWLAAGDRPHAVLACAFLGAVAAANADTWATELGLLAKRPPRLITTGCPVPEGTSGGVTTPGLLAALCGAAFIGMVAPAQAALLKGPSGWGPAVWTVPVVVAIAGFAGAAFDSLLGATVQAVYYCERCSMETESAVHRCGAQARPVRGWRWLGNDGVNFFSTAAGASIAALLAATLMHTVHFPLGR